MVYDEWALFMCQSNLFIALSSAKVTIASLIMIIHAFIENGALLKVESTITSKFHVYVFFT